VVECVGGNNRRPWGNRPRVSTGARSARFQVRFQRSHPCGSGRASRARSLPIWEQMDCMAGNPANGQPSSGTIPSTNRATITSHAARWRCRHLPNRGSRLLIPHRLSMKALAVPGRGGGPPLLAPNDPSRSSPPLRTAEPANKQACAADGRADRGLLALHAYGALARLILKVSLTWGGQPSASPRWDW